MTTVSAVDQTLPTRPLGRTGVAVPRVIFGTSALGNLYAIPNDETKLAILRAITTQLGQHAVLDSAGKYGAGLALEWIGRGLRELDVSHNEVTISNKLGWYRIPLAGTEPTFEPGVWKGLTFDAEQRISGEGIIQCHEQGCALLGPPYRPALLSVHDPDEYLAAATSDGDRNRRWHDVVQAYRALIDLRRRGKIRGVGVGSKDWRTIRTLADAVDLDWVMLACSFTVYTHPPELLAFIAELDQRRVGIINSAVFNGGFLTGHSEHFDYRLVLPTEARDRALLAWRDRFISVCQKHGVAPAAACVAFGLSAPGVVGIALNSSKPSRIAHNVALAHAVTPPALWTDLKSAKLIDPAYPYLG
jgi:D-threo-aldose 1-dehydrogenase